MTAVAPLRLRTLPSLSSFRGPTQEHMHGNEGADDARACPSACGLNGRSFAFGRSVCPSLRAVCLAAAVLAVALGREDAGAGSTGGGGGLLSASSVTPSFSSFLSSSARCVKPLLRRLWRVYLSGFALHSPVASSAPPSLRVYKTHVFARGGGTGGRAAHFTCLPPSQ